MPQHYFARNVGWDLVDHRSLPHNPTRTHCSVASVRRCAAAGRALLLLLLQQQHPL
jgi:hypothetical protein